jgi:hypothetical protein
MSTAIQMPFECFLDTDGTPLNNGKIYIGAVNTNPLVTANQIAVFYDSALTVPAVQPIRTLGGFPALQGTPKNVFVSDDYSIVIRNQKDETLFSQLTGSPYSASALLAKIKGVDGPGSGLIAEGLQSTQITDLNFDPSLLGETRIYTTSSGPANQFTGMSTTFYTIYLTRTDTAEYRVIVTGGTASDDMWTRIWSGSWGTAFRFTSQYDLVVDSNAALDAWVNNTSGNLKRVLIKSGTWTSSVTNPASGRFINLEAGGPGTVYVFGEPGSSIVFSVNLGTTIYGIAHAVGIPGSLTNTETFINVSVTMTNAGAGVATAFESCSNLIDCRATVTAHIPIAIDRCRNLVGCSTTTSGSGASSSAGFSNCLTLTNCFSTATHTGSQAQCFLNCNNLNLCIATATASAATLNAQGFGGCNNLSCCTATATGNTSGGGFAFSTCTFLSACTGAGTGGTTGNGVGFSSCTSMSSCQGSGLGGSPTKAGDGRGFDTCIQVTGCRGTGTVNGTGVGYGFFACQQCQSNRPASASSTATYNTSFADTATNATAATAAGGYNL